MGQKPSVQKPYHPPLILTFPWELIAIIMSFMDKHFELAFATTCKTLYERYELYYTTHGTSSIAVVIASKNSTAV